MEHLGEYPLLLDHIIQSEISAELLLDNKVITCAKFDQKYAEHVDNRLEEEFPEHIIGCKELDEDDVGKLFPKVKIKIKAFSENCHRHFKKYSNYSEVFRSRHRINYSM